MNHKIFFLLAVAFNVQALVFEKKEDFSYAAGLGNLEYYLRNGDEEIKSCYFQSKEDYKKVLNDFQKNLTNFSGKQKSSEEKKVVGRILKVAKDLIKYQEILTSRLENWDPSNTFDIATYVDEVRLQVKKDHDTHLKNIKQPLEWLKDKFHKLEESFKPVREEFIKEATQIVNQITECVDAPKC